MTECYIIIAQDIGLVADLAKILKQADQPIPDFLQGGGTASYKGNKYGGSDIRVSCFYTHFNVNVCWKSFCSMVLNHCLFVHANNREMNM